MQTLRQVAGHKKKCYNKMAETRDSMCSISMFWHTNENLLHLYIYIYIYNVYLKFRTRFLLISVHYNDVIMSAVASQITIVSIVWSTVGSGADQRKHQSSASLDLCKEFADDRWIPHTAQSMQRASNAETFPFHDVIMDKIDTNEAGYQMARYGTPLQWRHNEHDGVSNHQPPQTSTSLAFLRGIHQYIILFTFNFGHWKYHFRP